MRIIYAPQALRDVDEILANVQQRSPSGAHNLSIAIERAAEVCALNPHTGGRTDRLYVYRRPLRRYRYTIFYRVLPSEDAIEIARVVHAARIKNLGRLPQD
jgi:plasmid stabilization system protein ParE